VPTRTPASSASCSVPLDAYCADQVLTSSGVDGLIENLDESFLYVDPEFPPPPYTWLILIVVGGGGNGTLIEIAAELLRACPSLTVTGSDFAPELVPAATVALNEKNIVPGRRIAIGAVIEKLLRGRSARCSIIRLHPDSRAHRIRSRGHRHRQQSRASAPKRCSDSPSPRPSEESKAGSPSAKSTHSRCADLRIRDRRRNRLHPRNARHRNRRLE